MKNPTCLLRRFNNNQGSVDLIKNIKFLLNPLNFACGSIKIRQYTYKE